MLPVPTFEEKKVVSLFAVLTYGALFLGGLYLLYALRSLIPPILVATMIAITLINEVDRMERRGWRRGVAIALIYFLFLVIGAMIVRGINALASSDLFGLVESAIPAEFMKGSPQDITRAAAHWIDVHHVPAVLRRPILAQAGHIPEIANRFIQWTTANLPALAESLMWLVLVPVLAFFILLDFHKIIGKIFVLIPKGRRESLLTMVTEIIAVLGNYVRGVLLVMVLDMLVIYIVLQFFGLSRYAFVLAVTAGLFYTIPYLGAVVSTFLIGLTTLAATHSTTEALAVTAIMIFIHQIVFDNIVAPRVIGGSVNLHPLLTLLTLLSAGTLFGMWGVLLGVPVAAAAQVILINLFPQLKTDERLMLKAERAVKATLSTDSEAARPETRKAESVPELKKEESAARRDVEQDLKEHGAR